MGQQDAGGRATGRQQCDGMSYNVTVKDSATPKLNRLSKSISDGTIDNVIGRAATNVIRAHFDRLQQERPNRQGWARQNFWAACNRSTSYQSQPGISVIAIAKLGFRQRLEGGKIEAQNAKYLTIPATSEAYGKRAREFSNLKFGFAENKYGNLMPALIKASETRGQSTNRNKKGALKGRDAKKNIGNVMYWLTPRVFQVADPSVLPHEDVITTYAMAEADKHVRRITQ